MPDIQPRCSYSIETDSPHKLAIKKYGLGNRYPVVFLHGSPGSGCGDGLCDLFNLKKFRVIASDQRGAGGSILKGCLEQNQYGENTISFNDEITLTIKGISECDGKDVEWFNKKVESLRTAQAEVEIRCF